MENRPPKPERAEQLVAISKKKFCSQITNFDPTNIWSVELENPNASYALLTMPSKGQTDDCSILMGGYFLTIGDTTTFYFHMFGGSAQEGETPEGTLNRELREEVWFGMSEATCLETNIQETRFLGAFIYKSHSGKSKRTAIFSAKINPEGPELSFDFRENHLILAVKTAKFHEFMTRFDSKKNQGTLPKLGELIIQDLVQVIAKNIPDTLPEFTKLKCNINPIQKTPLMEFYPKWLEISC